MQLNEANFTLYAAKFYDNPVLDTSEFYEDLKRFSYLKRLFNQYEKKNELKTNLIINHIIILYNVFGDAATEMLFLRLKEHKPILKTFLVYLQRMPNRIFIGSNRQLNNNNIPIVETVKTELEKL